MHQLKTKFSSWYILAVLVVLQPPRGLEAHFENLFSKMHFQPVLVYYKHPRILLTLDACHPGFIPGAPYTI